MVSNPWRRVKQQMTFERHKMTLYRPIQAPRAAQVAKNIRIGALLLGLSLCSPIVEVNGQGVLQTGGRWDQVNAGLGMSTRGLPVFIGLEQTLDDHISAALIGTFQSYRENSSAGTWNHQFYAVGLQGNYHFIELAPSPYDFFAGLTISWSAHRFRWAGAAAAPNSYDGSAIGGTGLSAQIGGRYTYKGATFLVQLDGGTLNSGFLVGLSFPLSCSTSSSVSRLF